MKKIVSSLVFVYCFLPLLAQQNLGIRNSNFAGIQAALLNPSSIADSKLKWDVNILSVGVVYDNNFLYVPKGTIPFLGFKSIIKGIKNQDIFYTNFDPAQPDKRYNFTLSSEILGPSFHVEIMKKHVVGFTMLNRSYANIRNFSGHLAESAFDYLKNKGLWYAPFHDNSTKLNGMNWLEYGLEYATVLYKKDNRELTGGVTLKYLRGIAAAYVKNTNLTYRVADTSQLIFTNANLEYGRTDYDSYSSRHLNHGHGFGANIGFTYIVLKEAGANNGKPVVKKWNGPYQSNYIYKIGLSFIDLGSINFNKMASSFQLRSDSANFLNWHQSNFTNNLQVDRALSAVFYQGDSSKSLTSDHFRMGLPAAISIQADWNLYKNFFINATIVKGFGHGNRQGVVRPDVYSITPRFESKWFDASIPISLLYYGIWRPRIGLAVRAGYFFFGGDALGGLLGLHNFQGADFYAGAHFFITR